MKCLILLFAVFSSFTAADQSLFNKPVDVSIGDQVKETKETILEHKDYPHHKIRLLHTPTSSICDGDTKGYSGYLDVEDTKHFYFYFFESRSKPKEDPLIVRSLVSKIR